MRPFQVGNVLDHLGFNFHSAGNIDTIPVNVKLVIDLYNVIIVLQIHRKLIKQKGFILEEDRFLECFIPKDGFKFPVRKGIFQHIPVDHADSFTGFFFGEVLALKCQNIVEQGLVPSVPGSHIQELHAGFYRGKPLGKVLNIIFRAIQKNFPIHPIEAHNGITVVPANLGICFNTKRQGLLCPAFFHIPFRVSEIEVLSPCGLIHPAFQAQIPNNLEKKITGFRIVHINQNGFFPKNTGVFIKVLDFRTGFQFFNAFELFKALFVSGRNIATKKR